MKTQHRYEDISQDMQQSNEYLSCLAIVESEVVAGLEVEGNSGVGYALQVHGQHLLGHIIVVQLIVTQSHVNFQGQEISARQDATKKLAFRLISCRTWKKGMFRYVCFFRLKNICNLDILQMFPHHTLFLDCLT